MQIQSVFPNSQEEDENSKMRVEQIHKLEKFKMKSIYTNF
jgi:hypothetical protein